MCYFHKKNHNQIEEGSMEIISKTNLSMCQERIAITDHFKHDDCYKKLSMSSSRVCTCVPYITPCSNFS